MFYFLSDHFLGFLSLFAILICICGLIGNSLSTCVLLQKSMRSPSSYILLGLTFYDSLLLITFIALYGISFQFHYYFPKIDFTSIGIYTSYVYPLKRTAYTGTVYTSMLVSTERYISVCWPGLAERRLTLKTARNSLIVVLVFAILINIPRWFEHEIVEEEDGDGHLISITLLEHEDYLLYYEELLWSTSMYIIPFFFLLIINILIWKEQLELRNSPHHHMTAFQASETGLTKMLLTVVSVFFVLNLLNCLFVVFYLSVVGWKSITSETLGNLPIVINASVNFIIYITLGQNFRKEFFKMIRKKCLYREMSTAGMEPVVSFSIEDTH